MKQYIKFLYIIVAIFAFYQFIVSDVLWEKAYAIVILITIAVFIISEVKEWNLR